MSTGRLNLDLLDGDALLHTDFNPLNILLGPERTWLIDWAWPTHRSSAFRSADRSAFRIRGVSVRMTGTPAARWRISHSS
jgi:hypothetical protein